MKLAKMGDGGEGGRIALHCIELRGLIFIIHLEARVNTLGPPLAGNTRTLATIYGICWLQFNMGAGRAGRPSEGAKRAKEWPPAKNPAARPGGF